MLKRIVKMTCREEEIPVFMEIFENSKEKIKARPGCLHLELLRDCHHPATLFTLSIWQDEAALEQYRQSDLFIETWKKTKPLFAQKAAAWSLELVSDT